MRETRFLVFIFAFHARYGTDSSNRFDEIVSTMEPNRNPYSQRHVQAEITRDIEIIGSGGETPGKSLKV